MTHATLLARVAAGTDPAAWQEFCDRYALLIRGFAERQGLQAADCDEVAQESLLALAQAMPNFQYDRSKGTRTAIRRLGELYEAWGRPEEAAKYRATAP